MELTFDRILALIGIIAAIVLVVLDKAGKLKGPVLLVLLGIAALMTLPLALGNSWVKDTPWGMLKISKGTLMVSFVAICYSLLAIWISPSAVNDSANDGADAENQNRAPRDQSQKGFEIDSTPPVVGEGDITDDRGHKNYFADVYVQVSVLNHGEPSVIKKWGGLVRLPDGTTLEGTTSGMKNMNIYLNGVNGPIKLPVEPMLFEPWSRKPIPTGERVVGCLVFLFPAGTKARMSAPGGAFILKIWDASDRESSLERSWSPTSPTVGAFMLPGMSEPH